MTVTAAFMGLMPIMWSTGTGADVMKRIAAPMVGGLATSFLFNIEHGRKVPGEEVASRIPESRSRNLTLTLINV